MKKHRKEAVGLVKTGVVVGVGAGLASSAGQPLGSAMGMGMRTAGKVVGAGMVLGALKKLPKPKTKRR